MQETTSWQDAAALERYQMISPLLDPDLDDAKRIQLRREIASKNGLSERTISRYEKGYRENAFAGLRPMNRKMRRSSRLPDNWDEIVGQAIILKREVPRRSARQIIKILEIEGWAGPGVIKCDVKYGPDIRTKDGKLIHTYLSSLIDDHSRYILHSEFYDNKSASIVEDSVHKAILQHGKFDCGYTDNGKEYISTQLVKSCARLGIRLLRAKPRRGESKGKIEKFHQVCDSFISEIRIAKVHTLEELNRRWKVFLDQDYQKDPHDGIREYYESMDVNVPEEGISPLQEWNRDSREVVFIDAGVVGEAFLHHENRVIDPAGCFSFNGFMYEASTALAGARVEISYDPLDTSLITVNYQGMEPIRAKRVTISPYAQKKPPVPVAMTDAVPETSRFLDALEKRYKEENRMAADAISFVSYRKKEETNHV